jgi:hypothetical protein
LVTSLTLKAVPGLPEFPDLEKMYRNFTSSDMIFSFLRDFERRLKNATGSQDGFEVLCYVYLKKAILDHDVLVTFEKLMTPTKKSHAWSWETSRSMFLQDVDQERAMGDGVQRLYSIALREKDCIVRVRRMTTNVYSSSASSPVSSAARGSVAWTSETSKAPRNSSSSLMSGLGEVESGEKRKMEY